MPCALVGRNSLETGGRGGSGECSLSPKGTQRFWGGDFPSLPACAAAPSSAGAGRDPPNSPPRAPPAPEPARGEIRGVLWNAHVALSPLWACRGLPFPFFFFLFFYFFFLFLFNNFPNESSKSWNYFETLRFHHLLYIALFTASHSIIIMIIPLSDGGISGYIS